jgi:DNA-binding response OmpR family regulator
LTTPADNTAGNENATSPRRVLVADDEPHIGRIIKMKLERGPFDVTLAYDGQEAVDALVNATPPFDMALLDLMMPNLSGLDVLARLRKAHSTIPTVILTAAGQDEQQRAAMDLGATAFLTKPFSPKKLYALVAQLTGVDTDETT